MSRLECEPLPARTRREEAQALAGRDARGCRVATEAHDLAGGIVESRALRLVDVETAHRPGATGLSTAPLQSRF